MVEGGHEICCDLSRFLFGHRLYSSVPPSLAEPRYRNNSAENTGSASDNVSRITGTERTLVFASPCGLGLGANAPPRNRTSPHFPFEPLEFPYLFIIALSHNPTWRKSQHSGTFAWFKYQGDSKYFSTGLIQVSLQQPWMFPNEVGSIRPFVLRFDSQTDSR
jgi:hypothetical protein